MPAIPTYTFPTWTSGYNYSKWDVAFGATASDTRYFYSTLDNNSGAFPNTYLTYTPTQATRTDNVMRLSFNQTGTDYFQQGSIVAVQNMAAAIGGGNYTGVALAGGPGYVDYLNPGLDIDIATNIGQVVAPIHPNWSTGMMWIPSYSTDVTTEMAVISTKLGEGYSQNMNPVINSNSLSWNLVFAERTDKEIMGLLTFLQVAGGATPFVIDFPVGGLFNKPGLKYISQPARNGLTSFGLDATSVTVTQVFNV